MDSSKEPEKTEQTEVTQAKISVPQDISFDDLKLELTGEGRLRFDLDVIEKVCKASDLPVEVITKGPETNLAGLLVTWYQSHLAGGGEHNEVMDSLLKMH